MHSCVLLSIRLPLCSLQVVCRDCNTILGPPEAEGHEDYRGCTSPPHPGPDYLARKALLQQNQLLQLQNQQLQQQMGRM